MAAPGWRPATPPAGLMNRGARTHLDYQNTKLVGVPPRRMVLAEADLNRIKELHHGLEVDRTSCSRFLANLFRVLLTAAAYVLMQELRLRAAGTKLARARVSTLRDCLLKIGAASGADHCPDPQQGRPPAQEPPRRCPPVPW